jgi:pimeloyl-ACP methyl ester carboxylesterase
MRAALRDLLTEIHETTGRKVSIVGWSLGGVYARDLALQAPDMVRCDHAGKSVRQRREGDQRHAAL